MAPALRMTRLIKVSFKIFLLIFSLPTLPWSWCLNWIKFLLGRKLKLKLWGFKLKGRAFESDRKHLKHGFLFLPT
ncbi:hypothetical protein F4814DRAFT_357903 [Daldinia grandis]|nr:hypothetical protein F4814DRAFT_357903 [Daldinia grandis]